MQGLHKFVLNSPEWGEVRVVRVIPHRDDAWGVCAPLRDTPWGKQLSVVTGEALSHALHGHVTPLMRQIGPSPDRLLRLIPDPYRTCENAGKCHTYMPADCQPCAQMPDCYTPPVLSVESQEVGTMVALAWRDDYYVVLVDGAEFSL